MGIVFLFIRDGRGTPFLNFLAGSTWIHGVIRRNRD
ncbi:unnamed protein product [Phytomonas sp. Hart1]|nr:unnamed protein product [Phytomonas sp. Hart1]|eukprot:CCW66938.1 unnamed protein product [Phytomonas sp. isolate Hart1]